MQLSVSSQRSILCFSCAYTVLFVSTYLSDKLSVPMAVTVTAVVFVSLLLSVIYGWIGRHDGWFGLVWIIPAGASLILVGMNLMNEVTHLFSRHV